MFRVSSGHLVKFIKSYTICLSFLEQTEKKHGSCLPLLLTSHCVIAVHWQPAAFVSSENKVRTLPLASRNF